MIDFSEFHIQAVDTVEGWKIDGIKKWPGLGSYKSDKYGLWGGPSAVRSLRWPPDDPTLHRHHLEKRQYSISINLVTLQNSNSSSKTETEKHKPQPI